MQIKKNRYLIIQTAFLGDVILSTALIECIKEEEPDAEIDFLIRQGNESVLDTNSKVRKLWVWNKNEKKYLNLFKLLLLIRKEQYDQVFNIQRYFSTGLFTALSRAKKTTGYTNSLLSLFFSEKILYESNKHETLRVISLYKKDAKSIIRPKLYLPEQVYQNVEELTKCEAYITVFPSSKWHTKQYPENKWIELIDSLNPKYKVYLMGGSEDYEICKRILAQSKNKRVFNLVNQVNFHEAAALVEKAALNFSSDSAPTHIASAMNAPITTIFCSTIPAFGFYPISDVSHIIESEKALNCRPCGIHGQKKCPLGHFECAVTIDNKQLLDTMPI